MKVSIETVVETYKNQLFAAAFSICRNAADAEDAVQDTLIRYYEHQMEYRDEQHLKAWLLRVVINRAKDISSSFWQRHRQNWEEYMNEIAFSEPQEERFFEITMKLPQKYRIVMYLFYYEDFSVREIADILNCRESTIRCQLTRGRALLKSKLREEENDG